MPTLTLQPDGAGGVDTQLYQRDTQVTFNFGVTTTFAAGLNSLAGRIQRGLLLFSGLSAIPAGATITSAIVTLRCTTALSTGAFNVSFHRALVEWFEGAKNAAAPDAGQDGSTWNLRNANGSLAWGAVGGLAGTDYLALATATTSVTVQDADYTWDVTADVQAWVNGATNRGWFVVGNEANTAGNKIFASSDNTTVAIRPEIVVNYTMGNPGTPGIGGSYVRTSMPVGAF